MPGVQTQQTVVQTSIQNNTQSQQTVAWAPTQNNTHKGIKMESDSGT